MKKTIVSWVLLTTVLTSSLWIWMASANEQMTSTWPGTVMSSEPKVSVWKTELQRQQYQEIMKSLESEIYNLKSLTSTEWLETIKSKAQQLKVTYAEKVKNLNMDSTLTSGLIANLEVRVDTFIKNVSVMKPKVDELKEKTSQVRQEVKDVKDQATQVRQEVKPMLYAEQQAAIKEIMQSLETELKLVRESLTPETLDSAKAKIESLKTTYLEKVKALQFEAVVIENMTKILNERFSIFTKVNFVAKPTIVENKQEIKQVRETNRVENSQAREQLKMKYKVEFKKQLAPKVEKLPVERLNKVLVNIDKLVQTITDNTKLSTEKKDALLAQLQVFRDIVSDQIKVLTSWDDTTINFDQLISQ